MDKITLGAPPSVLYSLPSQPVSYADLKTELAAIYAGLMILECKCREIDSKQAASIQAQGHLNLDDLQWRILTDVHLCLLHQHYDFFLASQHPSASPSMRELALKYALPARMWNYGIHDFLEIVRHNPAHAETFIYATYHILTLCKPPPILFVYLRKLTIVE